MNESGLTVERIRRVHGKQLEMNARGDWVVVSDRRIASHVLGHPWLVVTTGGRRVLFLATAAKAHTATLRPVSGLSAAQYRALMAVNKALDMRWFSSEELVHAAKDMAGFDHPLGVIHEGQVMWFGSQAPGLGADLLAYTLQEQTLRLEDAGAWTGQLLSIKKANQPALTFLRALERSAASQKKPRVLGRQQGGGQGMAWVSWAGGRAGDDRFSLEVFNRRSGAQGQWFQDAHAGHALPLRRVDSPGGLALGVTMVGWHGPELQSQRALWCLGLLWQQRWLKFVAACEGDRGPKVRGQGGYGSWDGRTREALGLVQWAQWLHVETTWGKKSISAQSLLLLARAYMHEGSYKEAARFSKAAARTFSQGPEGVETWMGQAQATEMLAGSNLALNQWNLAARFYASARTSYLRAKDPLQAARMLESMAEVALAQGNKTQALQLLNASQREFRALGARALSAKIILDMSYLAWTQGQTDRAGRWLALGARQVQEHGDLMGQRRAKILRALYVEDEAALLSMREHAQSIDAHEVAWLNASLAWVDFQAIASADMTNPALKSEVGSELFHNSRSVFCAVHAACESSSDQGLSERFWRQLVTALYAQRSPQVMSIAASALKQNMPPAWALWLRFAMDSGECTAGPSRWSRLAHGAALEAGQWFELTKINAGAERGCVSTWTLKKALSLAKRDAWAMTLWGVDQGVVSFAQAEPYLDGEQRERWHLWTKEGAPGAGEVAAVGVEHARGLWWMRALLRRRAGKGAGEELRALRAMQEPEDREEDAVWQARVNLLSIDEEAGEAVGQRYKEVADALAEYAGVKAKLLRMLALALQAQAIGLPVQEPEGFEAWEVGRWSWGARARFHRYDAVRRRMAPEEEGRFKAAGGGLGRGMKVSPMWDLPLWTGGNE